MPTATPSTCLVLLDYTTAATPAALRPTPAFLADLVAALDEQVRGPFASEYGVQPVALRVGSGPTDRSPTEIAVNFRDTLSVPGALAYHTVVAGVPDVEVGCDLFTTLSTYVNPGDEAVSQGVGHEVLELLGDPGANCWEDSGQGFMRSREVADLVQNTGYAASNGLWMTNFLRRAAWVPGAPGPWDWLGVMASQDDYSSGYEVRAVPPGSTTQVGGMLGAAGHPTVGTVYAVGALSPTQLARRRSQHSRTHRRGVRL
jgi:hypothetical protein